MGQRPRKRARRPARADDLDARDWLVIDGYLQSTPITFDPSDRYHQLGARLAQQLVREFSGIACVLLAGSAAIRAANEIPRDLDLAVLLADGVEAPAGIGERMKASVQSERELPVDLVVMYARTLRTDPSLSLPTSLRSLLLVGEPAWPSPVRIPAQATALAQWELRRDELRTRLAELLRLLDRAPDASGSPELVLRVQKRALRLIAPVALSQLQRYSIELGRCAELVARLLPRSGKLAAAVAQDIQREAHDLDATARAVDLAVAVLGCEAMVREPPTSRGRVPHRRKETP